MQIVLNGEAHELEPGISLDGLLAHLGLRRDGIAVAINGEVISRGAHSEHWLQAGDQVEIIQAVGGG